MKTIHRSPESLRHQQFGDLAPSQFLALFSRPISYHRKLVDVTGSVTSAIMLGQAIFWSDITADPEKWFYKSQEEWKKETGMNRAEQEGARKILRSLGFWEENYERLTHRLWFRVNPEKFQEVAGALLNSSNGECVKQAVANQDIQQSSNCTEITSEEESFVLSSEKKKKPRTGTITESSRPSQSEIETFCSSISLPSSDGEAMFLHFEEKGWAKFKNWQAVIRKWKAFGYLPSQKMQPRNGNSPASFVPPKVTMTRL
jgi:hypothetical protein